MDRIERHKDLLVWHKAIQLAGKVYAVTRRLPSEERDGLSPQLRRTALSIPSSIAEGCARRTRTELLEFLQVALGSLSELETQLLISVEQDLLTVTECGFDQVAELSDLLAGLIRRLNTAAREAHAKACSPLTLGDRTIGAARSGNSGRQTLEP